MVRVSLTQTRRRAIRHRRWTLRETGLGPNEPLLRHIIALRSGEFSLTRSPKKREFIALHRTPLSTQARQKNSTPSSARDGVIFVPRRDIEPVYGCDNLSKIVVQMCRQI
jgi:hypothetical protein